MICGMSKEKLIANCGHTWPHGRDQVSRGREREREREREIERERERERELQLGQPIKLAQFYRPRVLGIIFFKRLRYHFCVVNNKAVTHG